MKQHRSKWLENKKINKKFNPERTKRELHIVLIPSRRGLNGHIKFFFAVSRFFIRCVQIYGRITCFFFYLYTSMPKTTI